ncbi:hypothetical protein BKA57DRAFT_503380 [Linnemannia elongata]|nr:hypothetical protein BKA57DRAFT_503380 [Linnemannia elongata]
MSRTGNVESMAYATQHGVDIATAAIMVQLINGGSAFGRITIGQISGKTGYINDPIRATLTFSFTSSSSGPS